MRQARILVVESRGATLRDLARSLESLGYVVAVAPVGMTAVAQARRFQPELALVDIGSEGTEGIAAGDRIHEQTGIPVVFLSPSADRRLAERVHTSSSYGYVDGAFSLRELGTVIELALHRHRMERALAMSEKRFRLLFDQNPAGVVVESVEGRIVECNCALARMLGYGSPELLRDELASVLFHDPLEDLERRHRLASGETIHNEETRLRHRDGRAVWVMDNAVLVPDPGPGGGQILRTLLDITERKQMEQGLERLAYRDALTGLANRRLLEVRAEQTLAEARRRGESAALVFIDLVGFKRVNDEIGHRAGDELLVHVARRLSSCLRRTDAAARFGGDEFMVLMSGVEDRAAAVTSAQRIIQTVSEPFTLDGREVRVLARAGVATFPDQAHTFERLVEVADRALTKAKGTPGPVVVLADETEPDDEYQRVRATEAGAL